MVLVCGAGGLLLLVHVHVLGVDHAVVLLLLGLRFAGGRFARGSRAGSGVGLVHGLGQLVRRGGQLLARGVQFLGRRSAFERLLGVSQGGLHFGLLLTRNLVAVLLQHLLDVVDEVVELVAGLDLVALGLVFGRVRLGFLGHALHLFLAESRGGGDGDLLVLAGGRILRGHVQNAVGVDVKGDLDLRHAARRRRNAAQLELAQRAVLPGHGALALQHVYFDFGLAVTRRREGLRLLGRDGRVARNHRRRHAAQRFDGQGQRRHVEQQQILDLTGQDARLHGRANRHHFIGVHAAMGLLAKELLDDLLNAGHAGLSAYQHHFVNLARVHTGIGHGLLAGLNGALQNVLDELLQLGAGQLLHQVLGAGCIGGDEGQVDLGFKRGRKLDLGALGGVLQALQGHFVALGAQVEAFVLLELVDEPVHDLLVEVVAAQVCVAIGRLHLDDAFAHFENGDVERTAAKVIYGDGLVLLLVEAIGQRGRGRLVDDALDVEPGNFAGVLGGLALRVVKVGRNRDDGLGHRGAQVVFGGLLELLQNHGRNFGGGVVLALRLDDDVVALLLDLVGHHLHFVVHFILAAAHEALDGVNRVLRIGNRLALGHLAHQTLAALGKSHHRRRGAAALFVGDHLRFAAFHHGHHGIGGSEVNSNNLCHCSLPAPVCKPFWC
ncbi:NAD-specific glutamate dehydrogenase domain protein [Acidobacterium capsulatum ATCC 51196]|uniref:NAD-specific glutamate dehydrogenase domain protein n=1 Tax=Acidobacterium capsulatum (strain ATCC 51196 / DSM 11244 / BCRC 80197 / JCM 7670 / NBRC 15755 / NCIMB 13165 / 161) TaxID=240015 RepID=C1F2D1_ACIC5|nr:NAD-specific glutamate dehydrogenase domain protein [Acidobacterium capsulatum ATCC 51196]